MVVTAAMLMAVSPLAMAADFPFGREMLLDAKPLPGSKRVPILEIAADGRAQIDLWCRSGTAQVEVTGGAIKVTLGPQREEACTPERSERDEAMIAALAQVTQWRAEDDVVILQGPTELRFRLSTHKLSGASAACLSFW
jgi:heat shock protein HslJ